MLSKASQWSASTGLIDLVKNSLDKLAAADLGCGGYFLQNEGEIVTKEDCGNRRRM